MGAGLNGGGLGPGEAGESGLKRGLGLAWLPQARSNPPTLAWLALCEPLGFVLVILLAQIQVVLLGWLLHDTG